MFPFLNSESVILAVNPNNPCADDSCFNVDIASLEECGRRATAACNLTELFSWYKSFLQSEIKVSLWFIK